MQRREQDGKGEQGAFHVSVFQGRFRAFLMPCVIRLHTRWLALRRRNVMPTLRCPVSWSWRPLEDDRFSVCHPDALHLSCAHSAGGLALQGVGSRGLDLA
jgi:hypothetical protein